MMFELASAAAVKERTSQDAEPLVVDFWKSDCPPCDALEPKLEQVAGSFEEQVSVYRLDVEEAVSLTERYEVMSVPTLIFFKDGEPVKRLDGLIDREELEAAFREVVQG